ncbi:hypothetical protein U5922_017625 [Aquicoccus sp. G2-2]|uniref:hypothetical protein n=1 Tax=Aquicoccus sp. G2-2 TaxID=3092120 RepID=UPI002ADFBE84|nr:hypothetical protein [Aquicoccus sp. G2-2]MEA1115199.1 hypothetical protein [Aquicoccus sp. G2-2]
MGLGERDNGRYPAAMIDTAFQHFARTRNIGDQSCCPAAYFDFGTAQVQDFGADVPMCHRAIFGGGQSFEQCVDAVIYHSENARRRVLWGVGIDNRASKGLSFEIMRGACNLLSSRNWGVRGCEYVPCVSAMSPHFDAPRTRA